MGLQSELGQTESTMQSNTRTIQSRIGERLVTALRNVPGTVDEQGLGTLVIRTVREFVDAGIPNEKIDKLTRHVYSAQLRDSVRLSMRTARFVYQLNLALVTAGRLRKTIARAQLIELGAAAEGLLFDLIQSIGSQNRPPGTRPTECKDHAIDWESDGLLGTYSTKKGEIRSHNVSFSWLIEKAHKSGAIDASLRARLDWLREARNVIHPTLSATRMYCFDLDEAREALFIVLSTAQATLAFKQKYHITF
jgi:hypothetical protein